MSEMASNIVSYGVIPVSLFAMAVCDIRNRYIPIPIIMVFAAGLAGFRAASGENMAFFLLGLLPGCFMIAASLLTKGKIGLADGGIFLAMGLGFGMKFATTLIFTSLLLAAVVSMFLLILKKAGKGTSLPFIPFITGGYAVCMVLAGMQ